MWSFYNSSSSSSSPGPQQHDDDNDDNNNDEDNETPRQLAHDDDHHNDHHHHHHRPGHDRMNRHHRAADDATLFPPGRGALATLSQEAARMSTIAEVDNNDYHHHPQPPPVPERLGTIPSAVLNILSTMVGGGSLSLPLALAYASGLQSSSSSSSPSSASWVDQPEDLIAHSSSSCRVLIHVLHQSLGPLLLLGTAALTEFCFRLHVHSARLVQDLDKPPPPPPLPAGVEGTGTATTTTTTFDSNYRSRHDRPLSTAAAAAPPPPPPPTTPPVQVVGQDSYTLVATAAWGPTMLTFSRGLVTAMCLFGSVGYAVLLRDMMHPLMSWLQQHILKDGRHDVSPEEWLSSSSSSSSPEGRGWSAWWSQNAVMLVLVAGITPLATLPNLTSLQSLGATSMTSILLVGFCVAFRALQQCLWRPGQLSVSEMIIIMSGMTGDRSSGSEEISFSSWSSPRSWRSVGQGLLDAFPLFVSCYVCHYNILPVHNELRDPSRARVRTWLKATVGSATLFYLGMALAGESYAQCAAASPDGGSLHIQGNILLNFPPHDPLLLLGRFCLAVTITLAFPLLTIPARDILLETFLTRPRPPPPVNADDGHDSAAETRSGRWWWPGGSHRDTEGLSEPLLSPPPEEEDEALHTGRLALDWREEVVNGEEEEEEDTLLQLARRTLLEVQKTPVSSRNEAPPSAGPPPPPPPINDDEEEEVVLEAAPPAASGPPETAVVFSWTARAGAAVGVLWSAALVASGVASIDTVWALLGSSLSIILSYLIPCSTYLVLVDRHRRQRRNDETRVEEEKEDRARERISVVVCWMVLLVYPILMILSTANAVHHTFFQKHA